MIDFTDEIVIIGCSLRKEDIRLLDMISSLKDNASVTIVNPHADKLEELILERNENLNIQTHYEYFEDYAKTL